jgi:hypothetical protein
MKVLTDRHGEMRASVADTLRPLAALAAEVVEG